VINIGFFDRIQFGKKKVSEDNYSAAEDNLGLDNENIGYERTGMPESDMFSSGRSMPNFQNTDSSLETGSGKSGFDRSGLPTHESFGSQEISALDQAGFDANKPSSIESFKQSQKLTTVDKELELISAKLDTIKLILDDLDRRIANLEKIAKE